MDAQFEPLSRLPRFEVFQRSSLRSIAVGSLRFVESVKSELRSRAMHRTVENAGGAYALREQGEAYNGDFGCKIKSLRPENTFFWNRNPVAADT